LTIIFWLIASSMTLLILVLLLWPLLKRTVAVTGEQEKTLSIFRQQFAELGQDRTNGVLTDELYEQARRELERRLLEETGTTVTTPTRAPRQVCNCHHHSGCQRVALLGTWESARHDAANCGFVVCARGARR
jgi:cytochrome c-type biogenesis protein CcmI